MFRLEVVIILPVGLGQAERNVGLGPRLRQKKLSQRKNSRSSAICVWVIPNHTSGNCINNCNN